MTSLTVKLDNGDSITIENIKTIRTNGDTSSDENDFQLFIPYSNEFYTFIGSNSTLTVYGKEIKSLLFNQN